MSLKFKQSLGRAHVDVGRLIFCAPEEDAHLAPIYKDVALGLVSDIAAETTAHHTVPGRQVHRIELGLDDLCDVVEDSLLLESKADTVDSVLLHLGHHVTLLHHCVLCVFLGNSSVCHHRVLVVILGLPHLGRCKSLFFRLCRRHLIN